MEAQSSNTLSDWYRRTRTRLEELQLISSLPSAFHSLDPHQRQIRVFHLEPAASHSYEIRGSFCVRSLDSRPDYCALSYVWGDSTFNSSRFVRIQNAKVFITLNLDIALRRLRKADSVRVLWIDALCINQVDLAERASQVALMHRVFGEASNVLVWLGEDWEGANLAIAAFSRLAEDENVHLHPEHATHLTLYGGKTLRNSDIGRMMTWFLNLPWFKRLWTVQEYALAKSVTLQCGRASLDGTILRRATGRISRHLDSCCRRALPSFVLSANEVARLPGLSAFDGNVFRNVYSLEVYRAESKRAPGLLMFVMSYRSREASDARDRIFALLGLISPNVERLHPLPEVSYARTVEDTYTSFAKEQALHLGHLAILSCRYGVPKLDLPSWVPDWTATVENHDRHIWRFRRLSCYHACGSTTPHHTRSSEARVLGLQGHVCDTIKEIFCPTDLASGLEDVQKALLLSPRDQDILEIYEPTGESLQQAFRLALTASIYPFGKYENTTLLRAVQAPDTAQSAKPAHNSYISTITYPEFYEIWERHRWPKFGALDKMTDDAATRQALYNLIKYYLLATEGRGFVVTQQGRFGFAPDICKPGDRIAVLFGGRVPYAIRSLEPAASETNASLAERKYRFLGDSYIHGIMQGEVVRDAREQGIPADTVVLV